ncbi:hypothetical protein [Francisella persica]|nr:hypothetical protein [Francisella persica]
MIFLKYIAIRYEFDYPQDNLIALAKDVLKVVDDKSKYTDYVILEKISR